MTKGPRDRWPGREPLPSTAWALRMIPLMALLLHLPAVGACSGAEPAADGGGEWVSEMTTVDGVTTVRTVSGSVWGGPAKLVEEASIGVDQGDAAYMLGQVRGLAASQDHIYVLDTQLPAVRLYDLEGRHLRDFGARGQGPGEFERPMDLAVGPDGRVYVREAARINVFTAEGDSVETWSINSTFSSSRPMVITSGGTVYFPDLLNKGADISEWQHGMQPIGPDGPYGEAVPEPDFDFEEARIIVRTENSTSSSNVPFSPNVVWSLSSTGSLIAGITDSYSFEIRRPDGSVIVVEKDTEPVPLSAAEREWHEKASTWNFRRQKPDWTWNGPPIPDLKPAMGTLFPDQGGRIWVQRTVGTLPVEDCDPDPTQPADRYPRPCWRTDHALDVFDEDGRYLGEVEWPELTRTAPRPFIKDQLVIAYAEDDLGTPYVKRYRLVPPGWET